MNVFLSAASIYFMIEGNKKLVFLSASADNAKRPPQSRRALFWLADTQQHRISCGGSPLTHRLTHIRSERAVHFRYHR